MKVMQINPDDVFDLLEAKEDIIAIDFGFATEFKKLSMYNLQQRKVTEVTNLLTDENNLFFKVVTE